VWPVIVADRTGEAVTTVNQPLLLSSCPSSPAHAFRRSRWMEATRPSTDAEKRLDRP
jgi:hypothetical protein